MATITKRCDRGIPSPYRTQNFTQEDASADDILDVDGSLGRPAK